MKDSWDKVPGTARPEKEISQRQRIAAAVAEARRQAEQVRQTSHPNYEEFGCRVYVLNGVITPQGKRAGYKISKLKTNEPFPDLKAPIRRTDRHMEARSRGYEY